MTQAPGLESIIKSFCEDIDKKTGFPRHPRSIEPPIDGQTRYCCDSRRTDDKTGKLCPYFLLIGNGCYCKYTPPTK